MPSASAWFILSAGFSDPARSIIRAGTPTAVQRGGTDLVTSEPGLPHGMFLFSWIGGEPCGFLLARLRNAAAGRTVKRTGASGLGGLNGAGALRADEAQEAIHPRIRRGRPQMAEIRKEVAEHDAVAAGRQSLCRARPCRRSARMDRGFPGSHSGIRAPGFEPARKCRPGHGASAVSSSTARPLPCGLACITASAGMTPAIS